MTALAWGETGTRYYEAGLDRAVFYPSSGAGVVWNGLISVDEKVSGGDQKPIYQDGIKRLDIMESEEFEASISAFSVPQEFMACDGFTSIAKGLFATQQPRSTFGFSYRTKRGNDISEDVGYKIHLVYNATASPTSRKNETLSDKTTPMDLNWDIYTVPPLSSLYKPTAHLVVDSLLVDDVLKMTALENILYGTESTNARLPTQAEVRDIFL